MYSTMGMRLRPATTTDEHEGRDEVLVMAARAMTPRRDARILRRLAHMPSPLQ